MPLAADTRHEWILLRKTRSQDKPGRELRSRGSPALAGGAHGTGSSQAPQAYPLFTMSRKPPGQTPQAELMFSSLTDAMDLVEPAGIEPATSSLQS